MIVYYNPRIDWQVTYAKAFEDCGFKSSEGIIQPPPDVCVVLGPHYAYDACKDNNRVLVVDRAWYSDPDCVSIGWLNKNGGRKFAQGSAPRPKPEMLEWRHTVGRCLVLADYGQDVSEVARYATNRFNAVTVRKHPAEQKSAVSLCDEIVRHDTVICTSGSAGFEAVRLGVPLVCLDPHNPLMPVSSGSVDHPLFRGDRTEWLHNLSYAQWSLEEIASGEAWAHLKDIQ